MSKSLLFSPIKIGNVTVKNRIVISPMSQYSCKDGFASDWQLVHLGARAIGGAGIVMMEATAVEARGRITLQCPGIWADEHIAQLKRISDFVKSQGAVPAIQLAHSGRKASTYAPWVDYTKHVPVEDCGWQAIAPSVLAFDPENDPIPKEATLSDIATIKSSYVSAALRSIKAGFDIIELHFAHGYLVQSFLSPYSNKRTDQYGGSFENRIRLALEIAQQIKAAIPQDYPLFVRISCLEFAPEGEHGWDLEQSIKLSKRFKKLGVHLVDCSTGGNVNKSLIAAWFNNVDQIPIAREIQQKADIPTGAVGGIVSVYWAEKILQQNSATLIFVARASLDDPNWPIHPAIELGQEHTIPPQYSFSIQTQSFSGWREVVLANKNQQQIDKSAVNSKQHLV